MNIADIKHLGLFQVDVLRIVTNLDNKQKSLIINKSNKNDIIDILSKYGITNHSVEIWGSGKPMREFLWSEDLADACVFLLKNRDFSDFFSNSFKNFNSYVTEITNICIK